mgnify:CR=1 FL=1
MDNDVKDLLEVTDLGVRKLHIKGLISEKLYNLWVDETDKSFK